MKLKQILVPLTGETKLSHVVDVAFALARDYRAHVVGTDTVTEPNLFLDQSGIGMMAAQTADLYKTAEKVQAHKREHAYELFDGARQRAGVPLSTLPGGAAGASAEWISGAPYNGMATSVLGRLCDLIVLGQPGEKASYADMQVFETAAFSARRPILMVPPGCSGVGNRVAIAWNGSSEACAAVHGGLALMSGADTVHIIQVGDIEPGGATSESLVQYLAWHGIAAKICKREDQSGRTSAIIAEEVKACGATMIVMGAYTHSPLRELILGGVTQSMTSKGTLPLLMAH